MLRDVVAGFLDTVTEREFDAPLIALLAARGFTDVHFLHGPFEFGKDFIAKGPKPAYGDTRTGDPASWTMHQFALQSKAGDLDLTKWREVRTQLDDARLDGLAHPSFDRDLPRAGVLVTTGRLTGGAPVQAQDYRTTERHRGRPDVEVWDRERLLEWLADSPDAGLAGTSDGPVLALAGAIDAQQITLPALERRGRAWLPAVPGSLHAATDPAAEVAARQRRAAVEAAVLGNRLRRHGRTDLAAMTALLLLRAAWCHALSGPPGSPPGRPEPPGPPSACSPGTRANAGADRTSGEGPARLPARPRPRRIPARRLPRRLRAGRGDPRSARAPGPPPGRGRHRRAGPARRTRREHRPGSAGASAGLRAPGQRRIRSLADRSGDPDCRSRCRGRRPVRGPCRGLDRGPLRSGGRGNRAGRNLGRRPGRSDLPAGRCLRERATQAESELPRDSAH